MAVITGRAAAIGTTSATATRTLTTTCGPSWVFCPHTKRSASGGTHHQFPVMTVHLADGQPGILIEVRATVSGRAGNSREML
jgi:hypothetical protein